jgi:hypothetical protein
MTESTSDGFLHYKYRFEHIYVPGRTGRGKSTLLHAMAYQDIKKDHGVTVIDPKGDLVRSLYNWIPERRKDDVVCVGLKIQTPLDFLYFNRDDENEKDELVEDLIFLLLKDAGNAPRAKSILYDVYYTILSSTIPVSFLDTYSFLMDRGRRDTILSGVHDPEYKRIWAKGVPNDEKLDPILHRMKKYVRNSTLKKIFGTPTGGINVAKIINDRKILFIDLGGASRAAMDFGSLVFQKMKQEVFRRNSVLPDKRIPHFVFIDEFQKFANVEDFKDVLMMARGYKFAMTLASPTLKDLPDHIKTGLGVIGNYIIFRLPAHDIPFFQGEIPPIHTKPVWRRIASGPGGMGWVDEPIDDLSYLTKLSHFEALYHLADGRTFLKKTPGIPPPKPDRNAEYTKKRTVDEYGCSEHKNIVQSKKHVSDHQDATENAAEPSNFLPHKAKKSGS